MQIELGGALFTLLPEKALYKEDESLLIIADVHLGKASHFRKAGIAVPASSQATDYKNLEAVFLRMEAKNVYFLGDLFHSSFNRDWHHFESLIRKFPEVHFTLIKGNHDIIDERLFEQLGIEVVFDFIETEQLIYSHKPMESDKLNIAGHIHPGIVISAGARQSLQLPCFYKDGNTFLLPAFGKLTGLYKMSPTSGSRVFAVLSEEVREL